MTSPPKITVIFPFQDYIQYLCVDHIIPQREKSCADVRRAYNATLFARGIAKKIQSLVKKMTLESVYIAAPPAVAKFIKDVSNLMPKFIEKMKIFGGQELENFLSKKLR